MSEAITVHPVTPDRWRDLVELFERPGPRGGKPMPASCWCMWWRERTGDGAKNKRAMGKLVRSGTRPGLLGYLEGSPVGWVSMAPRETYGQLLRSPRYRPRDDDTGVFAIVCFYVDPGSKGSGVGRALLDAAIASARDRGATAVEAYPSVKPDYMGRLESFERRGFRRIREEGSRVVVRLPLG